MISDITTAPSLLITGTDTEIGKTIVTTAIAAYWQTYLQPDNPTSLGIYKPIQCGSGDRELFQRVLNLDQSPEQITPQYFDAPLAPPIAALKAGQEIDLGLLWQQFNQLRSQKQFVLVEALGGLGSPLTNEYIVADLARDWALPTVLVVPVKIGAVGQTIANVALARANKIDLRGIILNCPIADQTEAEIADLAPIDMIESLANLPVLGRIPHLQPQDREDVTKLAHAATGLELVRLGL
ncbi:Dethiobiotin synthetase [Thalassoporum mexicanum PCC 7367]|uniref:dethiobiotin synthase n=1 Tax=Thalassoporum mexicanum TaxID=3457544 RepID=UPI00029FB555|nr:dethiobiotin synthase [Pseudanabaena sp. PCC 7367]AFY71728.1 Dethiobiotin synthetase [Pseudanabaena sp. PCC 7367]